MKDIFKALGIFLVGAMTSGFIKDALAVITERNEGNFGGEVLVLPLMLGLVWLGWELAVRWLKGSYSKRNYKKGYAAGRYQYISQSYKEQ